MNATLIDAVVARLTEQILGETETAPTSTPVMQIVVLQRGWIVIGNVTRTKDEVTVNDAKVIRKWGTTKGLGELRAGPTSKTALDDAGTVRAHPLSVVLTIDVDPAAWKS